VRTVAARRSASPAQVALAWLLHQGGDVVPIPGTKRRKYLEDNVGAAALALAPEDLRQLGELGATAGARYNDRALATIDR
jgi:aryl-alcohol dehydrogenase-like predicted oxidoreductase